MKFRKFTLKHITLVTLAPALIVWVVLTALTYRNPVNAGYNGLAAALIMFATSFALRKYNASFMKKAEKKLYDECDPYPTIEELKLYEECAGRRVNKTGISLARAMIQAFAGEYESAENTLRSFIAANDGTRSDLRAAVLYNLATLYCLMNLRENAVDCHDRAKEASSTFPDHIKEKIRLDMLTEAEIECYRGNGDDALRIAEEVSEDNKMRSVMKTFTLAKIHYITGAKSEAVEEFEWVSENGGRLACASEAAEIAKTAKELM